jgi:general stress protein CsbA
MKPLPKPILELVSRLFSKNPTFFKYVQVVSAIVLVVGYVPEIFNFLEITSPLWITKVVALSLKVGGFVAFLMAQLPNVDKPAEEPKP